jgi:hypothetical protein
MTRRSAGLVLAVGLMGLLAGDVSATGGGTSGAGAAGRVTWSETAWPFLRDQWGKGRAWRCEDCGADARLYVRSKVGFCDCFNHVDDDDDVDRLTDFDLRGNDRVVPLGAGHKLMVGRYPARLRTFRLEGRGSAMQVLAVVVAADCAARVAMLVSDRENTPQIEAAVVAAVGDHGVSRDPRVAANDQSDGLQ